MKSGGVQVAKYRQTATRVSDVGVGVILVGCVVSIAVSGVDGQQLAMELFTATVTVLSLVCGGVYARYSYTLFKFLIVTTSESSTIAGSVGRACNNRIFQSYCIFFFFVVQAVCCIVVALELKSNPLGTSESVYVCHVLYHVAFASNQLLFLKACANSVSKLNANKHKELGSSRSSSKKSISKNSVTLRTSVRLAPVRKSVATHVSANKPH